MNRIPLKEIAPLLRLTALNWEHDRAPRLGAALAYYMALSLAPTVIIILAITGMAFGPKAAQGRLVWQIQGLVGYEGAKVVQSMIEGAHRSSSGIVATLVGLVTLFFGAAAVVSELRDALNTIWRVPIDTTSTRARSIFNLAKERLHSFALVLGAGLFLLTSLIVNTWVSAAGKYLSSVATPPKAVIQTADWVVSFGLITALFAFIFKVLPDVRLSWGDVSAGAVLTSILFTGGQFVLGAYLGKAGFGDSYGAAGSLVVLLVWVYYSAQVVFLGAEFTRAYSLRFGSMSAAQPDPSDPYAES
jgi:membrane protein